MRIRKHAKISPLVHATSSLEPVPVIQAHFCQLNQSRWDVAVFSPPSSPPAHPPPSQAVEEDYPAANGSPVDCFKRLRESVVEVKREDSATDSMEEETLSPPPPPPAAEDEHFTWCSKTDGKNWHCRRKAAKGISLCEHHSSMVKSYAHKSDYPSAAAADGKKSGATAASRRQKKAPLTSSSSSNPYEFYYYSGFGPRWAKKRGVEADKNDDYDELIRRSIMAEEFDYVDESIGSDDDDDDEDADEFSEIRKKRGRKPVKARSLKSLM